MAKKKTLDEHRIAILDQHKFLNGSWIGAGIVSGGKDPKQNMGFRFVDEHGKVIVWADMSADNAIILAGCLVKAYHQLRELEETTNVKLDGPEIKKAD